MTLLTLQNPRDHANASKAMALVFEDGASRQLLRHIQLVAPSDATVLVMGETGTGKEIVARHLHALSRRARHPFVAVNCGALTESLVDSELFGHDRGAFTGATDARDGWFEAAQGGTLFLDEIGDLPLPVQVKLLRVLQEREIVRVGSRHPIAIDVRLVAATNVNLREAVTAGRFREDLFYRLNVATLRLLPLRERPVDILHLAQHFLNLYAQRLAICGVTFTAGASAALLAHAWPGNIRELENVVHHALLVCQEGRIGEHDLGLAPCAAAAGGARAITSDTGALERALIVLFERNTPDLHALVEETLVSSAYRYCQLNQVQTGRLLGISRNVVRAQLVRYGLLPARGGTARRGGSAPASGSAATDAQRGANVSLDVIDG